MTTTSTPNQTAYDLGVEAFRNGLNRAPFMNPTIQELINGLQVGQGAAPILKAYLHGWDSANVAEMLQ